MLTYAPDDLAPDAPLVVVLHGCAQRAGAYAHAAGWLSLADRFGFAVLAPEQTTAKNPNRCFNWFEPGDAGRDRGEAASIHAMVGHAVNAHALDARRVFVTGLSAGGAMTSALLAAYPDTFAAGAVVAGVPSGVAGNMHEAFAAMRSATRLGPADLAALLDQGAPAPARRPRLVIWHGGSDGTVVPGNASALARQWGAAHGLAEAPDEVLVRGGWTRQVWRGPSGQALIEMNLLSGLGHGTPLAAGGDDPIGEVAPFMLEAGVSSSLEIARFWGLAPPEADPAPWTAAEATPQTPASGVGDKVIALVSPHVPEEVTAVIAKALSSAGLRR